MTPGLCNGMAVWPLPPEEGFRRGPASAEEERMLVQDGIENFDRQELAEIASCDLADTAEAVIEALLADFESLNTARLLHQWRKQILQEVEKRVVRKLQREGVIV